MHGAAQPFRHRGEDPVGADALEHRREAARLAARGGRIGEGRAEGRVCASHPWLDCVRKELGV